MSKKSKKVDVEIRASKNDSPELTELEVLANNKIIGLVQQENDQQFQATAYNDRKMFLKTLDEAVQFILMEFNLHG